MPQTDKRVDAYIAKAQPFAQPILAHLRSLIHKAVPDVQETIKWGMPFFEHQGPLCNLAAFKAHCVMGFWKAKLMSDRSLQANAESEAAMGHLGRVAKMSDLPADKQILGWLKEAANLNESGVKAPRAAPKKNAPVKVPSIFSKALAKNPKAKKHFDAFSPSHRREYVDWIAEAKTDETRERRLATALEWLAQGKSRMWKYQRK